MTVHATAIAYGDKGVLIRGKSGSGKSALAGMLIRSAQSKGQFAALVSDDRVSLERSGSRIIASAPPSIAGKMEIYGFGIIDVPYEPEVVLECVIDIVNDGELERMPDDASLICDIEGITLRRQPVSYGNTVALLQASEAAIHGYRRLS